MSQVLLVLLGTFLCIGIGVAIGHTMASGGRERERADAVQKDFDEYKAEVKDHFAQTAEHFQTIGREYRALYDHMAVGANNLLDLNEADARLSFDPQPAKDAAEADQDVAEAEAAEAEVEAVADEPEAETVDIEPAADADVDASADASDDDDTTPDERARASGGESAPAGDEEILESADTAPEGVDADVNEPAEELSTESDEVVDAAGEEVAEADEPEETVKIDVATDDTDAEVADEAPEVLVEESKKPSDEAERTYH